jgi:predicted double-glycine peptidase
MTRRTNHKIRLILLLIFFNCTVPYRYCLAASFCVGNIRFDKKVKSLKEIKGRNVIKQSLDFSCGPAGLATILKYYFKENICEQTIIAALLKTTDINKVKERRGFSLLDLKRFSQAIGYEAVGYKMDMDFLKELNSPVLVPIKFKNYRHFVVIKGVIDDRVFFADPAAGNMTMKTNRFSMIWQDGIGLVFTGKGAAGVNAGCSPDISEDEAMTVDYKSIMRNLKNSMVRTAVYPLEY